MWSKLKEFKNSTPVLRSLWGPRTIKKRLKNIYREFCKTHNRKRYKDILFEESFGHKIDWKRPRDLNEVINYLSLKKESFEWSNLADKYLVRQYVQEKGLGHILVPIYGVWDTVYEIDFDILPEDFVIKTNCSSGDTLIIQGGADEIKRNLIKSKLLSSLSTYKQLFTDSAESHYLAIQPKIIAERLLSKPQEIVDYKVWCFNGEPFGIFTVTGRDIQAHSAYYAFYDTNWERHQEWLSEPYRNDIFVRKPMRIDDMLSYARSLSQGFPQVRVDFYEIQGQIYFGEMTFTSACGRMDYLSSEVLVTMGHLALNNIYFTT